jgi:hypothetical protein
MKTITEFAGQNWLITPAALAVGERQPASIKDQKWLLTLSGVAIVNLKGNNVNGEWLRETLQILPDMSGALQFAISRFSVPVPANPGYVLKGSSKVTSLFQIEEWAPFASIGSIFDKNESINAGFAVDVWRPSPFLTLSANGLPDIKQIFQGIRVDVAVNDNDAILNRVNYHITLLGKIVFAQPDPCQASEDKVREAKNLIESLASEITRLQQELQVAGPGQKPAIIRQITDIQSTQLPAAEIKLKEAQQALTICRGSIVVNF